MVASGLTSAEIAERLHLALGTVFSHRRDIMEKLGVRGAAELVRYAIRHKLVPV
jgi:two-component system NarL family response regulator